jgi:hypothetical protein
MKLKNLLESHPIISSLAQQKVSPRLAYGLQKNLRLIQAEMDAFDKARVQGLESLGCALDEAKGQYIIPDDRQAEWQRQYVDLLEADVSFQPHAISLTLLERDDVKLSAVEMLQVDWLFVEDGSVD